MASQILDGGFGESRRAGIFARYMRILYLHQYYRTPCEGGGVRSYHIAHGLAEAGHQVHVVTTWDGPARRVERNGRLLITYLPIAYGNHLGKGARVRAFWAFVWGSYRVARAWLPAGRVFATSTPLTIGLTALLLKAVHGVPYVFEVRDNWPEAPIQLGYVKGSAYAAALRWLERLIYRQARRLVVLSPPLQAHVAAKAPGKPIALIPNLADPATYLLERTGMAASIYHVVYAGTLGYANHLDRLLALALAARQAGMPVRFTLAGQGAEQEAIANFIAAHGLRQTVTMLPQLSNAGVARLLATADAAYVGFRPEPVLQQNSPNKFFDALAAGVPLLLGVEGWLAEAVRQSGCGVVLADYNADCAALQALMAADQPRLQQAAIALSARFAKDKLVPLAISAIEG